MQRSYGESTYIYLGSKVLSVARKEFSEISGEWENQDLCLELEKLGATLSLHERVPCRWEPWL